MKLLYRQELVQYSESFGICFQQQQFFEFLVIQAVPSWQGDEGRLGKKVSQRALKMAVWHSVCEREA